MDKQKGSRNRHKQKIFRAGDVDLPSSHTNRYPAQRVEEGTPVCAKGL